MASIDFSLFAPYNREASVVGEFSDWEPLSMTKDEGGTFHVSLELEDGDYQYKFRVRSKSWFLDEDAWVDVTDPYATRIADEERQNGVIRIENGQPISDLYNWQHDNKPLPPNEALVIYEVQVADFSGGEADDFARGTFGDVIDKLEYLSDLGISAIELMPLHDYAGAYSWGYSIRHFLAVKASYGSGADLKRLVDECHARGIRVLMDGVFNHSDTACPLTQIDHNYWYHHKPRDPENSWGPEFNYETFDEALGTFPARRFMNDVIRHWVGTYHLDGLRFDAARQLGNYDAMRDFVRVAQEAAGKPFYTVAEHIPEKWDIVKPEGPVDGCWHESFYHVVNKHLTGKARDFERLKEVLDGKRSGLSAATNLVNYLSNHDHDHFFAYLGDQGILDEGAYQRGKLGAALLMTAVGIPLIWMGQEFGEYKKKTPQQNKIDWTILRHKENKDLLETYKKLIHLRRDNAALHTANIAFFHENHDAGVLAYVRWHDAGARVAVIINLSDHDLNGYRVPNFPAGGTWRDTLHDRDLEAHDAQVILDLPAFSASVLVT